MADKILWRLRGGFGGFVRAVLSGAALAAGLSACAPSAEFQSVPQQGARRGGGYPSFSQKPQGATAQFSAEEQVRLTQTLRAEGQGLRAAAYAGDKAQKANAGSAARARKQADAEIEETLKQIKGASGGE